MGHKQHIYRYNWAQGAWFLLGYVYGRNEKGDSLCAYLPKPVRL